MSFADLLVKFRKELEDYWNNKMEPIYKRVWVRDNKIEYPVDMLKTHINDDRVTEFINTYKYSVDDFKAYIAHYFIKKVLNIRYKTDKESWDMIEYWQTPQETLEKGTGDCEDQTILWMKLMQLLDVPSYKCLAIGGEVVSGNNLTGHCYPVYFTGIRPVNMDLTYYSYIRKIQNRYTFKIPLNNYKTFWWAFNWKSCYKKPYWVR